MKHKKSKKRLPSHKNEPHPIACRGEVNKTFAIAAIAIVALVAISLLLFFTDTFVGKAIEIADAPGGEAGLFFSENSFISTEDEPIVPIKASLGDAQAVGFSFDLDVTGGEFICNDGDQSLNEWTLNLLKPKLEEYYKFGDDDLSTLNEVSCTPFT